MKSTAFIVLIVFLLSSCHSEKNVSLRLRYRPHQLFDVKYHEYITPKEGGDNLLARTGTIMDESTAMTLIVDSITADSSYIFKLKIYHIDIDDNSGLTGVKFSSDTKPDMVPEKDKSTYDKYRPLIDSTYTFTVNNRGEVIKPLSFAHSKMMVLPETSLLNFSFYQIIFPKEKIALGDKWEDQQVETKNDITKNTTYHLENTDSLKISVYGDYRRLQERSGFTGRCVLDKDTRGLISARIETTVRDFFGPLKKTISIEVISSGYAGD